MGLPPISIIGFGRKLVSSDNLVPKPPARITAIISQSLLIELDIPYSLAAESPIIPSPLMGEDTLLSCHKVIN